MKTSLSLLTVFFCAILMSCSSSQETSDSEMQPANTSNPSTTTRPQDMGSPASQPPATSPKSQTSKSQGERFAVQIGAYKLQENAAKIAQLARERFSMNVVTLTDQVDNLFKVMIGDFKTRDEARQMRDRMAQQFPDEYSDAWVAELPAQ